MAEIEERYSDTDEELPEEVDRRLGEIETELDDFEDRPVIYDPAEIARAGAFVSIDGDGRLKAERGYVRPEDEAQNEADGEAADAFVRDPIEIVHVGADGETRQVDPGTALRSEEHTSELQSLMRTS